MSQAILDYLAASGRLEAIRPADYLFAPLVNPLAALSGAAAEWDPSRPISYVHLSVILDQCAVRAGLQDRGLTWPGLKHTAALLFVESGADLEELEAFLGWDHHPGHTLLYLRRLVEQTEGRAPHPPAAPSGEGPDRAASASPSPEQSYANHLNRLKHGMYARYIPREALADLQAHPLQDLSQEIDAARYVLSTTLAGLNGAETDAARNTAIHNFSRILDRLERLVKTDLAAHPRPDPDDDDLAQSVRAVAAVKDWDLLPHDD